jgi:hypothetical protein
MYKPSGKRREIGTKYLSIIQKKFVLQMLRNLGFS